MIPLLRYSTSRIDGFNLNHLYSAFGVIDFLPDLSERSVRVALHNWMPRSPSLFTAANRSGMAKHEWSPLNVSMSNGMRRVSSSGQIGGQAADVCVFPSSDWEGCSTDGFCSPSLFTPSPSHQWLGNRIPSSSTSLHLSSTVRLLLVTSCLRSAATLQFYCDSLDIWLDVELSGERAMKRLSNDLMQRNRDPTNGLDLTGQSNRDEMEVEADEVPEDMKHGQGCDRRYDLIVVEPDLPGMSGYALCSWYRSAAQESASACHTAIKCVALADEPDTEACAAFGLDYCVMKPLSGLCFARLLSMWLNS